MVCKKCGAPLPEGAKFCKKCGEKTGLAPSRPRADLEPTVAADDVNRTVNFQTDADVERCNALIKTIWPDWTVTQKLGEGSFGKVYKAIRQDTGSTFSSAIKVISIPQSQAQVDTVRAEVGLDDPSTTSYFRAMVNDCVNEIKMMESFKGTQNIVSVEDYKVIENKGSIGWTILIRMELLTSFISYSMNRTFTEKEVVKLGIDICNALEYCAKLDVMHRDIKPENIFVSNFGDFKLGDFGIARKLERSNNGMSRKGTFNYMAPEIYNGGKYDFKSDIYSLGIVLYKLMNNNRFPLVDPRGPAVTYQQMQSAFEKRMAGAAFQKPVNASDAFSAVILSACAFNPKDRFASATAMKQALLNVQSGKTARPYDMTARMSNPVVPPARVQPPVTPQPPVEKKEKPKKERKKMSKQKKALIIVLTVLILLAGVAGYGGITFLTSGEYKVMKALDKGDYSDAVSQYDAKMDADVFWLRMLFRKEIEKDIASYKDDYVSGAMDKEKACNALSAIVEMNIPDLSDEAKAKRDEIEALEASKSAFDTAEAYMNADAPSKEDLLAAIEQYQLVKEYDANYDTARTRITEATDKYRDMVLAEAQAKADENKYGEAAVICGQGLENLPDDQTLLEKKAEYEGMDSDQSKQEVLNEVAGLKEERQYKEAIQKLNNALTRTPNDTTFAAELIKCKSEYEAYVLEQVGKMLETLDYDGAINLLNEALAVLPDSEALKAKKEDVVPNRPTLLSTITALNGNWEWDTDGEPTDPFGNTYSGTFKVFDSDWDEPKEFYNEYRLYGEYRTLTGILAPYKDIPENGTATLQVFVENENGEETLVYTSPEIGRKTDAFNFEVDISDAEYIRVVVTTNGDGQEVGCLLLMNAQLWKN